jgi:pimeloyl-ACP methyl ester carboxylesterase
MTLLSSMVEANSKRLREIADGLLTRFAPNVPLSRPIDAEEKTMTTHRGPTLAYYDDRTKHGDQRPLVLLHSVNACASSYEMRPLFEHYRALRPTYALDLPGFGLSSRGDRPYTIDLYVDSVRELLARVKDRDGEADVVALSLSGEFAAHVAATHKDLVHSLALLSPTGFDRTARQHSSLERPLKVVRREPVLSRLVFDAIASHPSISYFLRKTFVGAPDPGLVAYDYATSHQPGAQYAPLDFLAGNLFTPNVREDVYARVSVPSIVVYDTDPFVRFDALPSFVVAHASWQAERIAPTRGMPQFEQLPALTQALDTFWHYRGHPRRVS